MDKIEFNPIISKQQSIVDLLVRKYNWLKESIEKLKQQEPSLKIEGEIINLELDVFSVEAEIDVKRNFIKQLKTYYANEKTKMRTSK